jgi:hypothetical protein
MSERKKITLEISSEEYVSLVHVLRTEQVRYDEMFKNGVIHKIKYQERITYYGSLIGRIVSAWVNSGR